MPDPRLIESDKHVRPTLICTWLTITSTHSGLGTGQVQAPRVWQTCHTHIYLGLKTCVARHKKSARHRLAIFRCYV
jgi:hypothetical protein